MDRAVKPMLEVTGLRKVYEDASRTVEAIRDVSFSVGQGELVCIVGPSGAGKTTLLKCIAGLLAPTAGAVVVEGTPVTGPPPAMAVVFQEYGRSLFPWMSVHDNVALPLKQKKMAAERREELVRNALAAVDLKGVDTAYPWQLSGGMQQRVGLVRALAIDPKILLMDEPFASLDAQTREILQEELLRIMERLEERKTMVFITHSIDEAILLGDRIAVMTARPSRIKEIIDLPFGRPRDVEAIRADPRYAELRAHIWHELRAARPARAA